MPAPIVSPSAAGFLLDNPLGVNSIDYAITNGVTRIIKIILLQAKRECHRRHNHIAIFRDAGRHAGPRHPINITNAPTVSNRIDGAFLTANWGRCEYNPTSIKLTDRRLPAVDNL